MALFRVSNSRNGFVKDGNVNVAMRIYCWLPDLKLDDIAKNLNDKTKILTFLVPYIGVGMDALAESVTGLDSSNPFRIQFFFNPDESFFSIVIGWKVPASTKVHIDNGTVKFNVATLGFKAGIFPIITNLYEVHKNISVWDESHCNDAPVYDLEKRDCADYMTTIFANSKNPTSTISKAKIPGARKKGTTSSPVSAPSTSSPAPSTSTSTSSTVTAGSPPPQTISTTDVSNNITLNNEGGNE